MVAVTIYPVMVGVGVMAGFMSGLFGIGGGIIVTPLLVLIYPILSGQKLPIEVVTGLSSAQGFFSSLVSFALHRIKFQPDWRVIRSFAIPMAVANFFASLHAEAFSEDFILFVFGLLGLMSLLVTYLFHKPVALFCDHPSLSLPLIGLVLGVLCGLVGQGGGFIYLPVLISLFGLQIKQAISTSALIGIIGASGALFGRVGSSMDFLGYTGELVLGIVVGGFLGAMLSHRLDPRHLKQALNAFILLCSIQLMLRLLI
ncbi:sulfite exporter TauE/SafE family protein [Pseudomonas tolaasii]|uniref:Probable membrane transporter protein n=2 Tax=Pseudomonas tolaasii TaxID=29442 RepID=A0A7Y8DNZ5_PSETO|nr:sulfite exporter TauE/SafE family protein [Pseudomonas tolaasii]ARB29346.1 anion permease [Pseudomonas tolaasii]KAB0478097.1 sulfite exporter TauE/SafE family protein [Pseudomonas tolaasii]MBW4793613.1 sulfite exporter TauE/SafE family protein [Pseudomonas tolaasii]MBY8943991.1 sulfite exporter TauE/SafE family protein [Pseudomonas tolaasii]NWC20262.1 sulfite exporter TauE/SafE family protein [Pseudomonas tolaasii]